MDHDSRAIPFESGKLDDLMERAGIDVILVSSKHNVSYLLGGYRFFFFDFMDAIGTSRYLPLLAYFRGEPEKTVYIANVLESHERDLGKFWVPEIHAVSWGVADAVSEAVGAIEARLSRGARIGVECAFLPAEAWVMLADRFGEDRLVDALLLLERLRAVKSPSELAILREASEKVVSSMASVMSSAKPGITTAELVEQMRIEEVKRGLSFEYCLVTAGRGFNRAPSNQRWEQGEIASLDSGGNYRGYIGDVCRMAVMGAPDAELVDLLGEVERIQQGARHCIRAGTMGGDLIQAGADLLSGSQHRGFTTYVAHGMGLISHEAPRLTSRGPVPYEGTDAGLPLEAGMVLSIETTMHHPSRGFIKLEDTVVVTEEGWEGYGDSLRGWNPAGGG